MRADEAFDARISALHDSEREIYRGAPSRMYRSRIRIVEACTGAGEAQDLTAVGSYKNFAGKTFEGGERPGIQTLRAADFSHILDVLALVSRLNCCAGFSVA